MLSYLICFILYFYEIQYKEKLLKFLVILVLYASVLSVMLLLAAFQHQAAKEVKLAIYSFLIFLQSDHFTLPCDHIPQFSYLLKDFFFFNFTKNASGIASQLKWLGAKDCSVSI